MKRNTLTIILQSILLLVITAGCSAALPSTNVTPTTVPLAQRDLSTLVLQPGEMPSEFKTNSKEDFSGVFKNITEAHTDIVQSHVVLFRTDRNRQVYSNGIIVYKTVEQATKAFSGIKSGLESSTKINLAVEKLGDERAAISDVVTSEAMANKIFISIIIWRIGDSIVYVSNADSDKEPSYQQMSDLANKVNARITGASQ